MNPVLADPDLKINMSLDEIIRLTRNDINNELQGKYQKNFKKNKSARRMGDVTGREHPIPLMSSSSQASSICIAKKGFLSIENKRKIAQFLSNRVINSELLKKSKEIILAEYKLVKTVNGVERILVPAFEYNRNPIRKSQHTGKLNMEFPCSSSTPELHSELLDVPPPLVPAPIYQPPKSLSAKPDDEIIVLDSPSSGRQQQEVIDVESNLPVDIVEVKKLFMPGVSVMPQSGLKTLHDRFTLLAGNFQF